MSKTKDSVDTVINIHGFNYETADRMYEVVNKYDADAPDGFKDHRTTKLMNDNAGRNTISATFNSTLGLWDTGLYKGSPMYKGMSPEKENALIAQVKELIVEPFENLYGKDKLNPRDPDSPFWNYISQSSFKVDLFKGKLFNTNDPLDRLKLFICLANKDLAPKGQENSPMFRTAQFCIEDKDKVRDQKTDNDMLETQAFGEFYGLLGKPKTLETIFNYIGLKNVDVNNKDITVSLFKRWIENKSQSYQNQKLFVDTVKMNGSTKGRKELEYYTKIKNLVEDGQITKVDENYMLGDIKLGNNFKDAAKNVAKKQKMQLEIDKIINE